MAVFKSCCSSARHQNKVLIQKAQSKAGSKAMRLARENMAIADKMESTVAEELQSGLEAFKVQVNLTQLTSELEKGDLLNVLSVIPWEKIDLGLDNLPINQTVAVEESMELAIKRLKRKIRTPVNKEEISKQEDEFGFNIKNPRVAEAVNRNAGALIAQISDDGKAAVRRVATQAISQGITPRDAAKLLKESVGLTEKQSARIMNANFKMLEERTRLLAKARDLKTRGLSASKTGIKTHQKLALLTDKQIQKRSIKMLKDAQKNRIKTIARTELTNAINTGQLEVWNQGVENGLIEPNVEKVWVTINDADRSQICADLDGQRRKLNETFLVVQTGQSVQGPSAHPNCRSTLVLVEEGEEV